MKILVLGGSHEAHGIALGLADDICVSLFLSIPRDDQRQWPESREIRVGGFGSGKYFEDWMRASRIASIVDARHPFASDLTQMVAQALRRLDIDVVRVLRAEWTASCDDKWTFVENATDAAKNFPQGACVFLATGRRDLCGFCALKDRRLLCRVKSNAPEEFPCPNGGFIYAAGPFTVASERALFERRNVDWIVTRNSGGDGSWPKLAAARELGLSVAMIRRPPMPSVPVVETVDAALDWVRRRL